MGSNDDHALAILRLAWRLDALDEWRDKVDLRLGALEDAIRELVNSEKLAKALAVEMNKTQVQRLTQGNYKLSREQTWAAIASACLVAVGLVLNALGSAGVL